jgi:biotin carboxyl carrier protein
MPYTVHSEFIAQPFEASVQDHTVRLADGTTLSFETGPDGALIYALLDGKRVPLVVTMEGRNTVKLSLNGYTYRIDAFSERDQFFQRLLHDTATSASGTVKVVAPMPGLLKTVNVQNGQHVKKGERLFILEAMKMENEIKAPAEGVVAGVVAASGLAVEKNFLLCTIESGK